MPLMHLQTPQLALTNLLGSDVATVVVVVKANFSHDRTMQSADEKIVFDQKREEEGEWLVVDFLEPEGNENWPFVVKNAAAMGLKTPEATWLGEVENIPDELLLGDDPLWLRRVDSIGWIDLRKMVKERSKAQA
jgi:hypothetical protein